MAAPDSCSQARVARVEKVVKVVREVRVVKVERVEVRASALLRNSGHVPVCLEVSIIK